MSDDIARLTEALSDRYAVERELGAGGMATVYLATDVKHNRKVALKVLKPEHGAMLGVERFLSEIRVTANLQHPNLLPLFDSGEANGLLFYVMPFVDGHTLGARLEREKQLPIDEAVRISAAIAGALDYAHKQGVIHRDLTPDNILLQSGQPVIADFGIALAVSKAGGARVTQTGMSLRTPPYMSPERAMGDRAVDGRTDLYSLGAMTYEMLAGEPPHVHEPIALGLDSRHDGLGPAVHNRAAGLGDPPGERADAGARHRASNHCGTQYYGATTGDEQRPCSPPTELVARSQLRHTTQRRPRAGSNATRSPTGNASSDSLPLSDLWQKMQVENIAAGPRPARQVLPAFHMPKSRRLTRTHWRIVNIPDTYKPASEPDSHRAGASP